MRWTRIVVSAAFLLVGWTMAADAKTDLYTARTIVTGTDMRNRPSGFTRCLRDVLIKVSGNPRLADDPRLDPLAEHADQWVASFDYHDRMSGIPRHDEQGSRDRPYDLTVRFDPAKIDRTLAALGEQSWTKNRPRVLAFLSVTNGRGKNYLLRAAGDDGKDQRDSLAEAAVLYGLSVTLPDEEIPAREGDREERVPLRGSLVWSEKARGWVGSWRLSRQNRRYSWQVRGVSFDEAFRDMMQGCLQILSGHGAPPSRR